MIHYDIIWIGTGQAIGTVIPHLVKENKKIAICEGSNFGGSCVNYGCTPTKALVANARAIYQAGRGRDMGFSVSGLTVDFNKVMDRQRQMRKSGSVGLQKWLGDMNGVDLYTDNAEFLDEHTVRVGSQNLYGDTIVINTGTLAKVPQITGLQQTPWLDNKRLLDLNEKPQHLVIIGGSYVGLEFGQIFKRLGCDVTILEKGPQLMFREDKDIAEIAYNVLSKENINIHLNTQVENITRASGLTHIDMVKNSQNLSITGSHVLAATGRIPNTQSLNLAAANIATNASGYIPVNEHAQTQLPHIYALGDVNGKGAFTHTSVNDGQIFLDHYLGDGDRMISERHEIYNLYIDPPLGRVGMNEKQARKSGKNVLMGSMPMNKISRAKEKKETDGLVKLIIDKDSEQFAGATVFGTGGDEVISIIAALMYSKQTYKTLQRTVLPHPTVAELLPYVLNSLQSL